MDIYSLARSCDLAQYQRVVSQLPRPSDIQVDAFVQFVCGAHSWYKKLPIFPPGASFRFFLDPTVGFNRSEADEGVTVEERLEDDPDKFHCTWMPTATYRSRFGHLSYERGPNPLSAHSSPDPRPIATNTEGMPFFVPFEIANAGEVELTSIIHRHIADRGTWKGIYRRLALLARETGGDATLQATLSLCLPRSGASHGDDHAVNAELAALLLPEKQRLQQNMRDAIHRMLTVAYAEDGDWDLLQIDAVSP